MTGKAHWPVRAEVSSPGSSGWQMSPLNMLAFRLPEMMASIPGEEISVRQPTKFAGRRAARIPAGVRRRKQLLKAASSAQAHHKPAVPSHHYIRLRR